MTADSFAQRRCFVGIPRDHISERREPLVPFPLAPVHQLDLDELSVLNFLNGLLEPRLRARRALAPFPSLLVHRISEHFERLLKTIHSLMRRFNRFLNLFVCHAGNSCYKERRSSPLTAPTAAPARPQSAA